MAFRPPGLIGGLHALGHAGGAAFGHVINNPTMQWVGAQGWQQILRPGLIGSVMSATVPALLWGGHKIGNWTGLIESNNVMDFIGLNRKNAGAILDEIVDEKRIRAFFETFGTEINKIIGSAFAVVIGFQIASTAISLVSGYIQSYLNYMLGRPKLSTEYEFDSWATRAINLGTEAYGFAQKMILGKAPEQPHEAEAIFNSEIEEQINILKKGILNIRNHQGYFSNTLLYGPPGVGKTMVARQIAQEANMNFIVISGGGFAQFKSRGEHIKEVNDLFERVRLSDRPTLIFIDEIEGLVLNRDELDVDGKQLLNTFLGHTGSPSKKFVVIGATNRPKDIDSAFKSRCDNKIFIPPPGEEERMRMLKQYLPLFFGPNCFEDPFTPKFLDLLNQKMEGFVGRDIFKLCNNLVIARAAEDDNQLDQLLAFKTVERFIKNQTAMEDYDEKRTASSDQTTASPKPPPLSRAQVGAAPAS